MMCVGFILSLIGAFTLGGWFARAWCAIAGRLDARRTRIAAERATWADTMTKQTKPPPIPSIASAQPGGIEGARLAEWFGAALTTECAQDSTLPSPTAPASARKVRRVTKRRK